MEDILENNSPFFMVGSGRSGSTLLRMILCAHSKVTIPPETYIIMPLTAHLPIHKRLSEEQVKLAIKLMTSHYRWPDMGISSDELVAGISTDKPLYLRDIINVVYEDFLARDNKQIWGDKTPAYIAIVPLLLELYPEAKIVHLVRDGRDVTKSFQATGWYGAWLHENTREWKEAINFCEKYRIQCPNIDIYEVRYEDLVLNTEETVRNLCDCLSIDYEIDMLDWCSAVDGKIPAREAHIHKKISREPGRGDVYRWEKEMSKREIFIVESFIHKELMSAGYSLHYSGALWVPVFHLCRAWYATIFPVYAFILRTSRYVGRRISISH